jgi:hypothetical protein
MRETCDTIAYGEDKSQEAIKLREAQRHADCIGDGVQIINHGVPGRSTEDY